MNPERLASTLAKKVATCCGLIVLATASLLGAQTAPKGIELLDLDQSADPCTDFYAFANGTWRAKNSIPSGFERWSRRAAGREINRQQLTDLLEELAAKRDRPRGSVERQLGDFYAACRNESAIDTAGVNPLAPLLADLASVEDAEGVQRWIRRLHEMAIPVPFGATSASDYLDPEAVVLNLTGGGLGLPDRDAYLNPDVAHGQTRARYRTHVANLLALAGLSTDAAQKAAEEILALETRLAEASLPPEVAADPAATAHKMTFAQLSQFAKHFDWDRYFTEAHLPRIDVNIAAPAFFEQLDRELATTSVATWKSYLTWHLLNSAAPWLSKPFADAAFAFKNPVGDAAPRPSRAAICLETTEALLGEPLGRVYAERYFPHAAKAKVQEMIQTLLAVFAEDIAQLPWMSDSTRKQALAKIAAYEVTVGYPDTWTDFSKLVISRDSYWANVAAARRFGVELQRQRIGQRTSRSTWQLPPSSPAAYIDIQLNGMGLPAGFLQAPAFDLAASDAVNYGAIGVGIAHDLTHSIDALGRDFDAQGKPRKWWAQADLEAFEKVGQCTVDQYNGYTIEPGLPLDGRFVLGEALGDLAGVHLAFRALERSMKRHPVPTIDGFTPKQQFFLAWGQFRGATESLELQRRMITTDPHPTAKYRVIGPLANSPEFQRAFGCKDGAAMVRPPEKRCTAW